MISIIITVVNDYDELLNTIASINTTSGDDCELVIVDDASNIPVDLKPAPKVKLIRNEQRCGVGPSRHIGALHAAGDWLLIIDSHMRFLPGWHEKATEQLSPFEGSDLKHWNTQLFCATCLGLDRNNMNPAAPKSKYYGASLNVIGPNPNEPGQQVLEGNWLKSEPEDSTELSCVMGACYFIRKDWFLHLGALRFLKSWGSDEVILSLKCWLAGGTVKLMKSVGIGHRFLLPKERQPYTVRQGHTTFNKLFILYTIFAPYGYGWQLLDALGHLGQEFIEGRKLLNENWHLVAQEAAYNRTIFRRDLKWFLDKFNIGLPI